MAIKVLNLIYQVRFIIIFVLGEIAFLNAQESIPYDSLPDYINAEALKEEPNNCQWAIDTFVREAALRLDTFNLAQGIRFRGDVYWKRGNIDSARYYYYQSKDYFEKIDSPYYLAILNFKLGSCFYFKMNIDSTKHYYNNVLEQSKKYEFNALYSASISGLGLMSSIDRNYPDACNYFYQSIEISKELKDTFAIKTLYYNLATIFDNIHNYEKVKEHCHQIMDLCKKEGINVEGLVCNIYASALMELEELDSSLYYSNLAMEIGNKEKNQLIMSESIENRFYIFIKKNDIEQAKLMVDKFEALVKKATANFWVSKFFVIKSKLLSIQNEPKEALTYCKYLKNFIEENGSLENSDILDCEFCFYENYEKLGNYKKAMYHFKRYNKINNENNSNLKVQEIAIVENNQTNKIEKNRIELLNTNKINEINYNNRLKFFSFIILIGVILIAFSFRNNQLIKVKNKELKSVLLSNNKLEKYAYSVAHDLKNPLGSIILLNQLNKEIIKRYENKGVSENIELIDSSTRQLVKTVEEILSSSTLNAESLEMNEFYIKEAFEKVLVLLKKQIEDSNAVIHILKLPDKLIYNKINFERILQNLISNSIKFSKQNVVPIIEIKYKNESEKWLFSIKDNGIGMDKSNFKNIFQKNIQISTENNNGVGLGLFITKNIVKNHGGEIWVESSLGFGSTFYFTIPK